MSHPSPLLSICIPVKDFDVNPLVESLLKEIHEEQLPVELLVVEDGSSAENRILNAPLTQDPLVRIFSFSQNKGRAAARNFMAGHANGEYLLFIDADSLPVSTHFISLYLEKRQSDVILYGGRHYSDVYRTAYNHLHWKYGVKREVFSALKKDRVGFQSHNFFIKTSVFHTVKFDESIVLYGHEDTLFGLLAKQKGIHVTCLENPVVHTSLETNEVFLTKTEEGIQSLIQIIQQKASYPVDLEKEFKLWAIYKKLQRYRLTGLLNVLSLLKKPVRFLLQQFSGPLVFFDLYKLILLHQGLVAIQARHK